MKLSTGDEQLAEDVSAPESPRRGLIASDFEQIAKNGFGDRYNAYAHSMAWFQDHLYVGTSRNNFVMIKVTIDDGARKAHLPMWPVEKPDDFQEILNTLPSEIWRYNPRAKTWRRVYVSPMIRAESGFDVPECVSFRTMTVFQGASDPAPVLYVPTRPTSHAGGTVLLRSVDGLTFEPVSKPGLGLAEKPKGIRGFQVYKNRLFAAPSESGVRGVGNVASVMQIVESHDPARGGWRDACEFGFGDPTNKTAFDLAVFNGMLYAGTVNVEEGYQVWKTDAEGTPPYRWTKVLTRGAYRGPLNQMAQTLCAFKDHLYVGSAIQGFRDHENNIGPAPVEVVRIARDDSWELVCGEPRMTPDGLKIPISGLGPGFGCQTAGYLWQMCAHDGWLYAADAVWTILLRYSLRDEWPKIMQETLSEDLLDLIVHNFSGFDLWRTRDGVNWSVVTHNGFGNHYNIGCRTMVSTELGLFVGGINPFGPKVAVKRVGGWRYEQNPDSGCEVWLGRVDHESEQKVETATDSEPESGESAEERVVRHYYGDSDFRLCGYWSGGARTPKAACENLIEEVLSLVDEREGTLVDLSCGAGASTAYLLKHFDALRLLGLTTSRKLLGRCHRNAPEVRFKTTKLPRIRLSTASVDKVLCLEGGGFSCGTTLWTEIERVLAPGGQVVGSDFLFGDESRDGSSTPDSGHPDRDHLPACKQMLARVGLERVSVFDATEPCWAGYELHRSQHLNAKLRAVGAGEDFVREVSKKLPAAGRRVDGYVLYSAFKKTG